MSVGGPPWPTAEPERHEKLKLAVAVTGLVFITLFGWFLYQLAFSFLNFLGTLWGLVAILMLIVSAVAFVVALVFALARRRPPGPGPATTDTATYESVGTRPM